MGDGTAAAWVEYTPGTATARAARFDANGQLLGDIVTVATATNIPFIGIAANDASIVVVTAEKQGTYTYYADLWATRLSPAGAIEDRTLLTTRVEAFSLDAAMSDRGVVASWFDQAEGAVRVNIREPRASHVLPFPSTLALQDLAVNGETSMLVWLERSLEPRLHVLFPDSGEDVIVSDVPRSKFVFAVAEWRTDNPVCPSSLDRQDCLSSTIAWAESDNETTVVKTTAHSAVCLAIGNASLMTLRSGVLDALVTHQQGRVIVARPPVPRRRAVR